MFLPFDPSQHFPDTSQLIYPGLPAQLTLDLGYISHKYFLVADPGWQFAVF
jgi:hypothetical protein